MECKMCHNSELIIDADDYQMCCKCYLYYDKHNPKVIDDFENGIIIEEHKDNELGFCISCSGANVELIGEEYLCLDCGCCNGYKFDYYKKVQYYKKMFYNRKYHLEKYIKKYEKYENFDRIKVIVLFNKIVNRLLGFNLKRKRIYKFDLILKKVFAILDYNIEINTKESKSLNEFFKLFDQ